MKEQRRFEKQNKVTYEVYLLITECELSATTFFE